MLGRLFASVKQLWLLALLERASPRGIGSSVAVGVFCGCTPFIGFHAIMAVAFATVLRLNRLWALVGSRVSFFLVLPWIILAEIQTGHRLRTGQWAQLTLRDAASNAKAWFDDWCIGTTPVGLALALVLGSVAYVLSARGLLTPRTPAPAPAPSSGSPP